MGGAEFLIDRCERVEVIQRIGPNQNRFSTKPRAVQFLKSQQGQFDLGHRGLTKVTNGELCG